MTAATAPTAAKPAPTCTVVRPGGTYEGKQGLSYFSGVAAETVGATGLCMHLLSMPPGARAKAHLHEAHETAIYVLAGEARMRHGEGLGQEVTVAAGDFLCIPAGVPHLSFNASQTEPCVAVITRTDPNEQESVVLLPELESTVPS